LRRHDRLRGAGRRNSHCRSPASGLNGQHSHANSPRLRRSRDAEDSGLDAEVMVGLTLLVKQPHAEREAYLRQHCGLVMPLKISAFPKCYIDQIAGSRTMSVFDWIEMARALNADGLEMYDGFFTSLDDGYVDRVGHAIHSAGFAMPMLCCSPDF